ncbi:MAG: hypothetical protein A4E28_01123 [Methanocella sp. PtaU1.Bin125]|nr:MAG: hypothetical protein A4E28_01123 [Methanocella sp. PtaU1.Bin125]
MAMRDIFESPSAIAIFDFLAANDGFSYTISEISEFTALSRATVHNKLPALILNRLIEIDGVAGHVKTYRLAHNELVTGLVTAVFQHSFMMADIEDEGQALEQIKSSIGRQPEYSENRYYNPATDSPPGDSPSPAGIREPGVQAAENEKSDAA